MFFAHIYGQKQAIAFLRRSVETGRVAHSCLFYGMDGVGKTTTALALARALNCPGTETAESQGGEPCRSCRNMASGSHPDLIRIQRRGQDITIHDIRELSAVLRYRPMEAQRRVVLVEKADAMNGPAANALLKTLEEPAAGNVIVLITSRPDRLPATILSRCRKIRFTPLDREEVAAYLMDQCGMDEEQARMRAALSGGSIGQALTRDTGTCRAVAEPVIRLAQGAADPDNADPAAVVSVVEGFGDDKNTVKEQLDMLKEWFRDVLILYATGERRRLIHGNLADETEVFSRMRSIEDIVAGIESIDRARRAIEGNVNQRLVLESMLLHLAGSSAERAVLR